MHKNKGITKVKFSPVKTFSILVVLILLIISGKLKAQNTFFLQKAFQSCLDHPKIQPHLKAVSFDHHEEVLAIVKTNYVTSEIKLTQFGKEAVISNDTDLFFYGIEDYVRLSDISTDKEKIALTIQAGIEFTCTYDENKGKVIKVIKSGEE
ncbi:hypothetical protein O3Q51_11910 [Cryomorphaceae bacterium 1068]|nr:hypothetical protein [Cryomorphaceae bacterium 1068]